MSHRASWPLGIAFLVLAQGCSAPRIRIERSCPPCIQLESNATVGLEIVIDPAGGQAIVRQEAAELVRRELERHLQRGPYPLVDVRAAKVIVRACPTQWSFQWPIPPLPGQNGLGHLRVRIEVLHANSPNAPCIYSSTYWAKVHVPDQMGAMARAADLVSDNFVADLRPSRICNVVEMDDSDSRVETGIRLCEVGQFDAAYTAFSDLAARAPDSAPILYNLAVLKESRGEYDDAETLLLQATKREPKAIYYVALERVRAARRDAEALGKTP
jgi:tetratricopeptide (TPR) repeat protein